MEACAQHVSAVRAIYTEAADKIEQLGMRKLYYEIELPLLRILAEMEVAGCAVAPDELRAFGDKLDARIEVLVSQIYEDAGGEFNINSTRQLGEVLFDKLACRHRKRPRPAIPPMWTCWKSSRTSTRSSQRFWNTAS